jgi:hypothetical protein
LDNNQVVTKLKSNPTAIMTKKEKTLSFGLLVLTKKVIDLEETQIAMARIMSISLPCGAKQQRILQTAIARAESQNDQSRAGLEALKALLNED